MRYEVDFYILFRRNSVFKWLNGRLEDTCGKNASRIKNKNAERFSKPALIQSKET
jgi:hypothetical protein